MYPLNNYDMKFYGNNRVVCLLARDTDPENYEEGAIHFRYKDNDGTGSVYVKLYLYLPQGRELKADNFIIIR